MRAFSLFSVPSIFKFLIVRSVDAHQQLRTRVDALEAAVSALMPPANPSARPVVTDAIPQGSSTTPIRYSWGWPRGGKA